MKRIMVKVVFLILSAANSPLYSYEIELYHAEPHLDEALMRKFKEHFHIQCLVETGTWVGETAFLASQIFSEVYTVEIHPKLFEQGNALLNERKNVHRYCDESAHFLASLMHQFPKNSLFWLDAHYCGEGSGTVYIRGTEIKSPLRDEVVCVLDHFDSSHVLLIDDLRGYLNLPEERRVGREYATIYELYLLAKSHNLAFYVLGDMALIYDPSHYAVSVSPFVEACTMSYVFNPFIRDAQINLERVAQAEYFLMTEKGDNKIEQTFCNLCRTAFYSEDWSGFYPILWQGLRAMQQKDYEKALECFEKLYTVAPLICHDRFRLYQAKCCQELGDKEKTRQLLLSLDDEIKSYGPFFGLGRLANFREN